MTTALPITEERLLKLDTCVLSDAMDRLGLNGALGGFQRWGPRRPVAGRVITVSLEIGSASRGGSHLGTTALSTAGPSDVIVVANAGRSEAASWGGLLTLEAQIRKVSAVIVDGALRDADEVDALDVPVLARGSTPQSARGRFHEVATNVPVRIGAVTVGPGALVLADGSGVVFMADDRLEEILEVAEGLQVEEVSIANRLKAGQEGRAVMGRRYETMLEGTE
jgi:4-hydroxy-4-methyl-2-oxoglutarate aldolase